MGASSFRPVRNQPARASGPVGFWATLLLGCALGAPSAHAAANAHAEALAALADTRAAIAEIVHAEDRIVNSPLPYHRAAHRAINALAGEGDRAFDKASGNPGDAAGAIGHVQRALDRRDSPRWVDALHGVQVNLMAAIARLQDALDARQMEDYQLQVTQALLNLQAAVGRPRQIGVFGGLTGTLATTTLGIPAGARRVSACAPVTQAPAYGVKDGYLAFVAVPAASGTVGLPEDFGSRDVSVHAARIVVRTAAAQVVAGLCRHLAATPPPAPQARRDPPPGDPPAPPGESSIPALYTTAQAKAGRRVFVQHCVKCHGSNLQGTSAPAVAGSTFLETAHRNGWTLDTLRYLVVTAMPFNSPGTLAPKQYAEVLAFLLAKNCFPAGDQPFPEHEDDRFKAIALRPLSDPSADPKLHTCRAGR